MRQIWTCCEQRSRRCPIDPFGRSDDLARLASNGYELELTDGGLLLIKHVPYRTEAGTVDYGTIIGPSGGRDTPACTTTAHYVTTSA